MHNTSLRTNRFLLAALVTGFAAGAAPAWGQVINEEIKLLASDGEAFDNFGLSIAIDNGVVAVGVLGDDDNGTDSGSAYLFNASTGAQIAKLLPSDGTAGDNFGFSIAIDNGVVAVGAFYDDDNGMQPLGRVGEVQDIVDVVLYLADTQFVTGVVLPVDGGVSAGGA